MTLFEAFHSGHLRVWLPVWVPLNYIELDPIGDLLSPWVRLFFPPDGLEEFACPAHILRFTFSPDGWEPYEGPTVEPRGGLPLSSAGNL